jgi:hypothetical protein
VGSFVLLSVCAAGLAASSVNASKGIRYGIQDDAWLAFDPGTLDQRMATFKRLGVPLGRFRLHRNEIARRRPTNPTSPRDRAYCDSRLARLGRQQLVAKTVARAAQMAAFWRFG